MRIHQHIIDTKAIKKVLNHLPDSWVVRELTERDYGIDLMIEIFIESGTDNLGHKKYDSSGYICYLQIKGTDKVFDINIDNTISYQLNKKSLLYVEKFATPFLLVHVSTKDDDDEIYFVWLQRYIIDKLDVQNNNWRDDNQATYAIKIPKNNKLNRNIKKIELISSRIKYIEEHSEFVERFKAISDYFELYKVVNFDDKLYEYILAELNRITRLSTMLDRNSCCIDKNCVQELINLVIQIRDGNVDKSVLIDYPHKNNFEILLNENYYRYEVESSVAENDNSTVY